MNTSPKSKKTTLWLAVLLGMFGAHRFYVGKIGTGMAQFVLTLSLIGMLVSSWWLIADWISILCDRFTDGDNLKVKNW